MAPGKTATWTAAAAARSSEEQDQQDSSSDRDTHFNPDSSPKLPADLYADADRTAQAEFEEAVADGWRFILC